MITTHAFQGPSNLTHLLRVSGRADDNDYVVISRKFFQMLGYGAYPVYSDELAVAIDGQLRKDFKSLRLVRVETTFNPRTQDTSRTLCLRDEITKNTYDVLLRAVKEHAPESRASA